MRESRPSGSVEGVMGNHDSYTDPFPLRLPSRPELVDRTGEFGGGRSSPTRKGVADN